ncbi:MAG: DNA mismatch repair endonuclease MutL [Bdellovibrionales bacterium]|nr:DNA mismatch repair endonuclease MutL [Bdellovibrionales bacterium]
MPIAVVPERMERIQILGSEIVDQIAAGEVVERPAHLVKELVENSLDANAKTIEVSYAQGGRQVEVRDDGFGIHPEDLALAVTRHATSKIKKSDDLWSLNSYGFRGEALATAASVSEVTISTKSETKAGAQINVNFGQLGEVVDSSSEPGTRIRVEKLFENVPARLKFLKSDGAESSQIRKMLRALALVRPEVEFRVKQENRLVDHWPRTTSLLERSKAILNQDELYHVKDSVGGVEIELVYSSPDRTNRTSQGIWIFVQDRYVQDRGLQVAILDAYKNLLMHGEYPFVVARLNLDPSEVDVNVHPTKSQVKFRDSSQMFRILRGTLRKALEGAPWLARLHKSEGNTNENSYRVQDSLSPIEKPQAHNLSFESSAFEKTQLKIKNWNPTQKANENPNDSLATTIVQTPIYEVSHAWSSMHVIGQSQLTYIVAQSNRALVLVDQHAAHERVVFERLMQKWRKKEIEVQKLLFPLTLDFETEIIEGLIALAQDLLNIGIEVEQMGPNTLAVNSIPSLVKESALAPVLEKMGREFAENGGSLVMENVVGDLFATMACHSVVRAGQSLSNEEMSSLLKQMDEFPLSSFCPHGRPVFVEYLFKEIDRSFGRIF